MLSASTHMFRWVLSMLFHVSVYLLLPNSPTLPGFSQISHEKCICCQETTLFATQASLHYPCKDVCQCVSGLWAFAMLIWAPQWLSDLLREQEATKVPRAASTLMQTDTPRAHTGHSAQTDVDSERRGSVVVCVCSLFFPFFTNYWC